MPYPQGRVCGNVNPHSHGSTRIIKDRDQSENEEEEFRSVGIRENPWPTFLWQDDAAGSFLRRNHRRFVIRKLRK